MRPPVEVNAREAEWNTLTRFVGDDAPHATLGLVSGRRRMGKSTLLRALCTTTGGFYHEGRSRLHSEALEDLRTDLQKFGGSRSVDFRTWSEAIDAVLALGTSRRIPVVLDNVAGLGHTPGRLADLIDRAVDPARPETRASMARLLLGGSAAATHGLPLLRNQVLRDRAELDLRLNGLDYRAAAAWWGVEDPQVALPLYVMLGGTPVYRDWAGEVPGSVAELGPFAARTVLNPANPLFDAARWVLREEPGPEEIGFYRAISYTLAFGTTRLDHIARNLHREPIELRKYLSTMEACGLIERRSDAFEPGLWHYRINEPLLGFFMPMMRQDIGRLKRGYIHEYLWKYRAPRFVKYIKGPWFAQICRTWATDYAPKDLFGAGPVRIGLGTLQDPLVTARQDIPFVALGDPVDDRPDLRAIGICSWDNPMGLPDLVRLQRFRDLLRSAGRHETGRTALLCFGGAGFSDDLRAEASRGTVTLIDPATLYGHQG